MNEQLLKTSGADVLSSRKKLRKTLWGSGIHPPPPFYVRGLIGLKMTLVKFTNPTERLQGERRLLLSHLQLRLRL